MNDAAAKGELMLPRCRDCAEVQYPLRELCGNCLGEHATWTRVSPRGRLLSWTMLYASLEPYFQERLPFKIGSVQLECGPVLIVHLEIADPQAGMKVRVTPRLDASGTAVLVATPAAQPLSKTT
jgi:uncharacterized OB-fold protein